LLRRDLPSAVLVIALLAVTAAVEPAVFSYEGLDLTFIGLVPLVCAAVAQLVIMVGGDIDLSIGSAFGLVNVICATSLNSHPVIGVLELLGFVAAYVAMGALIELRRLPSLVMTFAFGFVWLGLALVILPDPGGTVPTWVTTAFGATVPWVPEPILLISGFAVVSWMYLTMTRPGRLIRAIGARKLSVQQYTRGPVNVKILMYATAAVVIIIGGLALSAQSGSGDPNSGQSYVLVSIAAIILGGGEFGGGLAWPVGAVLGAVAFGLVSTIDTYLSISSNLVSGVEGAILLIALGLRRSLRGLEIRHVAGRILTVGDSDGDEAPGNEDVPDLVSVAPELPGASL